MFCGDEQAVLTLVDDRPTASGNKILKHVSASNLGQQAVVRNDSSQAAPQDENKQMQHAVQCVGMDWNA